MKKLKTGNKLLIAAFVMCSALLATPSFADTTYTYTGNTLFGNACNGCSVDGSFTVVSPLNTGSFGATFQPESYDFTVDGLDFNNTNSTDGAGFYLATDNAGDITNWLINLTNSQGDVFTADTFIGDSDAFTDGSGRQSTAAINIENPGNWTASDPTATPEPSSLMLLSSGLLSLGLFRRKLFQS